MALEITYLSHSGFLLRAGSAGLAIDPFLTGNPLSVHTPAEIRCTHVALTHGHDDHFGDDTLAIAKANDAPVIASHEITNFCAQQGCRVEPANTGGTIVTDFGSVTFVPAIHSSSYQGRYMGAACGLVVNMGGVTFYHLGDTALFADLKRIGEQYKPDVIAVPIGDRFTMNAIEASAAAEWIGAPTAIPIHYKTFPLLAQHAREFTPAGIAVKELQPGETWSAG